MAKRKKGSAEGHVNHERWLITYADLITLLMVFFVVMFAMSRADVAKFAKLQASLQRAFNVEVLRGEVPTALNGENGTLSPTSAIQDSLTTQSVVAPDTRLIATMEQLRQALLQVPLPEQSRGSVQVGTARDGVAISLAGNALFDSGKAELKPEGLALLDALAERVRELPNQIRIEGHTDNTPIATPLYPSNWELSSARATTVARYLAERGGISPGRLIAAGYGEHRPVASNETREGRARNRRVDVIVVSTPAQPAPVPAGPSGAAGGSPSAPAQSPSHKAVHD